MQDLPIDRLGPFPILQFAAAMLVIGGLAIAIWRGMRTKSGSAIVIPDEQRWFFDGPLTTALNMMRDNRNHLGRLVELLEHSEVHRLVTLHEEIISEQRDQTVLLRDIKNQLEIISRQR